MNKNMDQKQNEGRARLERMLARYERVRYESIMPATGKRTYAHCKMLAIGKRAVMISMIFFLIFGISLTTYAARKPLFVYLQAWFSDGDPEQRIYAPQYIPEGFTLFSFHIEEENKTLIFSDGTQEIIFLQSCDTLSEKEIDEFQIVNVGNIEVATYTEGSHRIYLMGYEHQMLQYTFPIALSEEECLKMIRRTQVHETGGDCSDWESTEKNCTKATHCILCDTVVKEATYRYHDIGEDVINVNDPLYHMVFCQHKTASGDLCEKNLLDVHSFSNGICTECGYQG